MRTDNADTKVAGTVEAVGDKFNGSLKVNGAWYNLKKGVKQTAKAGDTVSLTLGEWEFKGKTGVNVTAIDVVAASVESEAKEARSISSSRSSFSTGRDFDKEARGKTLCQYITAQLSNPSVDHTDLKAIFDRAHELMNMTFNGVNG